MGPAGPGARLAHVRLSRSRSQGGRWIRYYDDALLIDGDGRVHDSRPGWDWDRDGERWGQDGDGVPVYAGNGDYQPAAATMNGPSATTGRVGRGRASSSASMSSTGRWAPMGPPPPPARGCGGGYGYGAAYMGYGPVLVTETTVTEAPVVEQRTYRQL